MGRTGEIEWEIIKPAALNKKRTKVNRIMKLLLKTVLILQRRIERINFKRAIICNIRIVNKWTKRRKK